MKTSSPGGHFRQIAQYLWGVQMSPGAGRLDFGHFSSQIEPIFILQLLSAKSANIRSIRIILSRFPKSSHILRKDICSPLIDAIAALFFYKMTNEIIKIFLDFLKNIVYNKGTKTKG